MTENHIPGVMRVADEIHPELLEHEPAFRERLSLFPKGCMVLVDGEEVGGYVVSFPVRHGKLPALNAVLGEIPQDADQYYLHDIAVLPALRGQGVAGDAIRQILELAKQYPTTCLISVYGTVPYWHRFGFVRGPVDAAMEEKLRGYGPGATYLIHQNRP
jgi:predicted N-acetyltransferase YhbS